MCGGTFGVFNAFIIRTGPSPRVRGNLINVAEALDIPRTIPACAGEPQTDNPLALPDQDHPRVCGGTLSAARLKKCCSGPSPRVRGNHHMELSKACLHRTIPACAGEPLCNKYPHIKNKVRFIKNVQNLPATNPFLSK